MKKISISAFVFLMAIFALASCKNEKTDSTEKAGDTIEQSQVEETKVDANDLPGDTYNLNTGDTRISWAATKVGGAHNGTIAVKDGFVKVQDGMVSGGQINIDMNSITVLDLEGEWKDKLEQHLKGTVEGKEDHFFNTPKFPVATFNITKVGKLESEGEEKGGKSMIYGDLTMKGVTKPIGFTAVVRLAEDVIKVETSEIVLNRTEWGVNYKSKSIFPDFQDDFIYDEFKLNIGFAAVKS